ncbi:aspartate kinase [Atractiella rhizophila]|nr:aspartate kinase [Atractiella rhizophila]
MVEEPATKKMLVNKHGCPWIIQKYGGTSLGKFSAAVGDITTAYLQDNKRVALVCSARSGSTKATGTTNLLLKCTLEAVRPTKGPTIVNNGRSGSPAFLARPTPAARITSHSESSTTEDPRTLSHCLSSSFSVDDQPPPPYALTVKQILEDHLKAARQVVRDKQLREELEEELEWECEKLHNYLAAIQILGEISPRSKDTVISVGERLSAKITTALLRDRGIDAEFVGLENIIQRDMEDTTGTIDPFVQQLGQPFHDNLSRLLGERITECGERVPVLTGFFGACPGSLLAQVGRGYSDLCAALCAVGVKAAELEIWKEVDGIFTADPSKVPTARLLSSITPEEAQEITYYGSEVVHPTTMNQAIRVEIPIRIKNVSNSAGHGTIVYPEPLVAPTDVHQKLRLPTAITSKESVIIINVKSNRKTLSHGFFARVFGILDRYGVAVDLIATSEVQLSMAIPSIRAIVLERILTDLQAFGEVSVQREMAILSLVGRLKNMVGIAARFFDVLAENQINLEMISQGASETNISCVIAAKQAPRALNLVHQKLFTPGFDLPQTNSYAGPWFF